MVVNFGDNFVEKNLKVIAGKQWKKVMFKREKFLRLPE